MSDDGVLSFGEGTEIYGDGVLKIKEYILYLTLNRMDYIKTIDVNYVPTQIDYTALANLPNFNVLVYIE